MDLLLTKFSDIIKGIITGFDRIVFKGMLLPIMYPAGMMSFLNSRNVLNKDFKTYAMTQSKKIIESADEMSNRLCGCDTIFIWSSNDRKEEIAHKRQNETGITDGLIGVWSCLESCYTFHSTFNQRATYPILRRDQTRCKHLYFYFDDPLYGFMSVRLQTWAPYEIQIALNGREWLRRSLDANKCGYISNGNKFLHIDDYGLAQDLLDAQLKVDFQALLRNGKITTVKIIVAFSVISLDVTTYVFDTCYSAIPKQFSAFRLSKYERCRRRQDVILLDFVAK